MNFPFLKNWWLLALKGFFAILFGSLALVYPQDTILILTLYFGFVTIFSGVFVSIFALTNRAGKHWGWFLLEGLIDLLFGVAIIMNPTMTVYFFTILIGVWLMMSGVFRLWFAIRNKAEIPFWGTSILNGLVTLLLGIGIAFFPISGVISLSWLIGFTAIFFGGFLVATSFQMRKINKELN